MSTTATEVDSLNSLSISYQTTSAFSGNADLAHHGCQGLGSYSFWSTLPGRKGKARLGKQGGKRMPEIYGSERVATTRAGEPWLTAECRRLVEQVRAGKSVLELAAEFGRTDEAIRARCRMLLPPERRAARNSKRMAVVMLAEELRNDPEYDWEQQLIAHATAAGTLYWSEAMDSALLEGWQRGASWDELIQATGVGEREMANRLKRRGLVASQQEVFDRLGPVGTTRAHQTRPVDLDPAPVWVLVVSGLRGEPPHVSLHTRRSGAEATLATVARKHLAGGGHIDELDITIVSRAPID